MLGETNDFDGEFASPRRVVPKRYAAHPNSGSFDILDSRTLRSSDASAFIPVKLNLNSVSTLEYHNIDTRVESPSYYRAVLTPGPLYDPTDENDNEKPTIHKTVSKTKSIHFEDEDILSVRHNLSFAEFPEISSRNSSAEIFPTDSQSSSATGEPEPDMVATNLDFLESLARRQLNNSSGFAHNYSTDFASPPKALPTRDIRVNESLFLSDTTRSISAKDVDMKYNQQPYRSYDALNHTSQNQSIFANSLESLHLTPKADDYSPHSRDSIDLRRSDYSTTRPESYLNPTQRYMPNNSGIFGGNVIEDMTAFTSPDGVDIPPGSYFMDPSLEAPRLNQMQQPVHHDTPQLDRDLYSRINSNAYSVRPSLSGYRSQMRPSVDPIKISTRLSDSTLYTRKSNSSSTSPKSTSSLLRMHSQQNMPMDGYSRKSKDGIYDNKHVMRRREDQAESPNSKNAYKDFTQQLRSSDKITVESAKILADEALHRMSGGSRWRVYLDLAEVAKKNSEFEQARDFFRNCTTLNPLAGQSWLEWSKMEEEFGDLFFSVRILRKGLSKCSFHEGLLTRGLKQLERLHEVNVARNILSVLKYESIDKVWRSILEGALLESRIGRIDVARKFFKYLMHHISWFGPIYLEAFRLEEKTDNLSGALFIIRKGLAELPRYGPLWFGLLRMCESIDISVERREWMLGMRPCLSRVMTEAAVAIQSISKELVWKIHFEIAGMQERAADISCIGMYFNGSESITKIRSFMYQDVRHSYVRSILSCPQNLRWKVLLVASRLELVCGRLDISKKFLNRAWLEVPEKSKSVVFLECSRVEEYLGNIDVARDILKRARTEVRSDWKIFMESVMLEIRQGNLHRAVESVREALTVHPGAGRLWSIFIHICHRIECSNMLEIMNVPTKHEVLLNSLSRCPKSGEIWCEAARNHLNPFLIHDFDLTLAQRYLCFAAQFTPQYGDTFLESLRVEIITQTLLAHILVNLRLPVEWFIDMFLCEDNETDTYSLSRSPSRNLANLSFNDTVTSSCDFITQIENMEYDFASNLDFTGPVLDSLKLRCATADPNFGSVWFYSRARPSDTPVAVLRSSCQTFQHELIIASHVYGRAIGRYVFRCISSVKDIAVDTRLNAAAAAYLTEARAIYSFRDVEQTVHFVDNNRCVLASSEFLATLVEMNRTVSFDSLSNEDKRFVLFGADQITP